MNPIEFLKQNGLNPADYQTALPPTRVTLTTPELPLPKRRKVKCKMWKTVEVSHSLLSTFLAKRGWVTNGKTIAGPFIPYLLADLIYLTHEEFLKNKLSRKAKFHCNAMMENYHTFIHDFFSTFDNEQTNEAVDMMDNFGEFIHNDLEVFRFSIVQPLMDYPLEFRQTLSAICVCRLLATHADRTWELLFSGAYGEKDINKQLRAIDHHSAEMYNWFCKENQRANAAKIDLINQPAVELSMKRVSDKILEFIHKYDEEHK